jgi:hypothetical protein
VLSHALSQFTIAIAEAVLNCRPRVAIGLAYLFEDIAVVVLEADRAVILAPVGSSIRATWASE